ncbi:hypothetical protein JCM19233_586 [Vibrio astriarenae]|nr:hypothetical protein JCM19233_586 [Vibrio sp. C7]
MRDNAMNRFTFKVAAIAAAIVAGNASAAPVRQALMSMVQTTYSFQKLS